MHNFGNILLQTSVSPAGYHSSMRSWILGLLLSFVLLAGGFVMLYGNELGWHQEDFGNVAPYLVMGIALVFLPFHLLRLRDFNPKHYYAVLYEEGVIVKKGPRARQFIQISFDDLAGIQDVWMHIRGSNQIERNIEIIPKNGKNFVVTTHSLKTLQDYDLFLDQLCARYKWHVTKDMIKSDIKNFELKINIVGKKIFLKDERLFFNNGQESLHLKDLYSTKDDAANNRLQFISMVNDREKVVFDAPLRNLMNLHLLYFAHDLVRYDDVSWLGANKMKQFIKVNTVSPEKQSQLVVGAPLVYQNYECPRIFKMANHSTTMEQQGIMLTEAWGIADSKSALDVLKHLADAETHTARARRIFEADGMEGYIVRDDMEGLRNKSREGYMFAETFELLQGLPSGYSYSKQELSDINRFEAWDLGRAVSIAKMCVNSGYLAEEEVWPYIEKAASSTAQIYSNWKEFLAAYAFGRALGYGGHPDDLRRTIHYLLRDVNSPYKDTEFPKKEAEDGYNF
ncbi:MAG: DUF1266 domain-containing protein [Defluviitaleaceae bacterium]|nr:DUF1266 domain-containing protein [Defluviitaleaceae bacterium]